MTGKEMANDDRPTLTIIRDQVARKGPKCSCGNDEFINVAITIRSESSDFKEKDTWIECNNPHCHRRYYTGRIKTAVKNSKLRN